MFDHKVLRTLERDPQVLQERRGQVTVNSTSEAEADEHLRPLMLAQIQQCYLKSISELSSIATESQLLAHAIPTTEIPSEADMYTPRTSAADDTWRLDGSTSKQARKQSWFDSSAGPVLNNEGRVLRPFTITGSSSNTSPESALSTRLALQDTVFGPGYRLPTMSVDEFLDIEYARGNVLQGGEADAQRQEIESARRKQMVEMDNRQGYEEGERRLEEERRGDEFRDTHRRGDGNRIGRG